MKLKPTAPKRRAVAVGAVVLGVALLAANLSSRADVLYVSIWGNTIKKLDLATGADLGVFASTGLSLPMGLAIDGAGNLFVANNGDDTIMKFTPDGVGSVFASTGLKWPRGLAIDSDGNLYVANGGNNTIVRFTPDGVGSVFASSGLNSPSGLAFNSAGNLYAANYQYQGNTIQKFTPDGVRSLFANTGLVYPMGLAFDSAGNLYAANQYTSTIEKFSLDGVPSLFASSGLSNPIGLAVDSDGTLYVANQAGWIKKFTPDGRGSLFANTGFAPPDVPMFIAIQQIPEPGVCALLVLGFPILTGFRCRKVKQLMALRCYSHRGIETVTLSRNQTNS